MYVQCTYMRWSVAAAKNGKSKNSNYSNIHFDVDDDGNANTNVVWAECQKPKAHGHNIHIITDFKSIESFAIDDMRVRRCGLVDWNHYSYRYTLRLKAIIIDATWNLWKSLNSSLSNVVIPFKLIWCQSMGVEFLMEFGRNVWSSVHFVVFTVSLIPFL